MRSMSACALLLVASISHAVVPGTVIQNRAAATGQVAGAPVSRDSNIVSVTVGTAAAASVSAMLTPNNVIDSQQGATVLVSHTLTNTGTATDTFTLGFVDTNNGGWSYSTPALFADADGDGRPDNATPITTVTLAPGQAYRFVARLTVPMNAPAGTQNDLRVTALAASGALVLPVTDRVVLRPQIPVDCGSASKSISKESGPSPAGPIRITLGFDACEKARARVVLVDPLPQGMKYVRGSARFSGTGDAALTDDVVGNDHQGAGPGTEIAYDFNVSNTGAVTATVFNVPAHGAGAISFDVEIDSGIKSGTTIANTARYAFYDVGDRFALDGRTNTVAYSVNGRIDFTLSGERLPTVQPGTTVTFTNVLTNVGDVADTYDITLSGSTFPQGTTFTLMKSDGVTPLADSNGNSVPDTGVVAPGGKYLIIVKASIPATAPPGAYKVTKMARSTAWPGRSEPADDAVDAIATRCAISLDPDNAAQVGFGEHVTYQHWLTNRGNCDEGVRAMVDYLADSRPGWTSTVYVDNVNGGAGSIQGTVDATDTSVKQGWNTVLRPGQVLRLLVDVRAPTQAALTAAAKTKSVADSNLTTLVVTSGQSGALTVHDTTNVSGDEPRGEQNAIRNFTDSSYGAPTLVAAVGGHLWLRADAQSCNASPTQVDTRTVIVTNPNGDREELVATETGANTGIFIVRALPAVALRNGAAVAGNGQAEGSLNDVLTVELLGCGRRIETEVTLVDGKSVVFDSRTNEPVEGASVTLVTTRNGECTTTPAAWGASTVAAANPALTGAKGTYTFPAMAEGDYCLKVAPPNGYRFASKTPWSQLPDGRNLSVSGPTQGGSYGGAFHVAAGGLVMVDIPVDPVAQDGIFVQKTASRQVAEIGEFVDYIVTVRNNTGRALDRGLLALTDDLPLGFGYVAGTARRDGKPLADPVGGTAQVAFNLGSLDRDTETSITYRVRIGPAAMEGDGVNRAQARYVVSGTASLSNVATAKVVVSGGVFTNKGFILGKVFADCNANGEQDRGEPGVAGVRLVMEDGTYVITDGGGKFSFYGVSNRTHVVKVDATTLPAGARLAAISSRNLGDGNSRIVDLKAGELHRADFAIAGCEAPVANEIKRRAAIIAKKDDALGTLASTKLEPDRIAPADVKSLPASGVVSVTPPAIPGQPATQTAPLPGVQIPASAAGAAKTSEAIAPSKDAQAQKLPDLEKIVPTLDNKLAFINLTDGETLPFAQTPIRVKGTAGARFVLNVNDVEVSDKKVGKRAVLQDKQLQAWEYIGIELKAGDNKVELAQIDAFGNPRGSVIIHVKAPGKLSRVAVELPKGGAVADGRTGAKIVVRLLDAQDVPVTSRTPVTLEASRGTWDVEDLDPLEPGTQVMVENGHAEFALMAPTEPGESLIVVTAGVAKSEAKLDFMPELRSLIAAGVVEGIVNIRKLDAKSLLPARASDGFEQELQHLSRTSGDGQRSAAARAAFFLKGKIKGEYLLTAAYDSDKDTSERLFRDIQPDEFYPVYGDAAIRGYDAQSTARLYVRIDNKKSYLLYGDFTTQGDNNLLRLSNYSRSLTGLRQHYDNGRVVANAFASRDTTRQMIDEIKANGTSGPYMLSSATGLVNSEKVEILTRDRNRPTLILRSVAQARFYDYELEPLTGRVLFKSPVPSVDQDLNPISIRVTYEVDQGGEQFWVFGGDATVKVTDNIAVGASFAEDRNPAAPFKLRGAYGIVRIGEKTMVAVEVAQAEHPDKEEKGNAERVHVKHDGDRLKAEAFFARTDKDFDNPGAYLAQGRGESGARAEYKVDEKTRIKAEALRTEDRAAGNTRDGAMVSAERTFGNGLKAEVAIRHAHEDGVPAIPPTIVGEGGSPVPNDVTTVRTRVTSPVPFVKADASVYGEVEMDTQDADRRVIAVGGNYVLPNHGKVYFRHEFISSLTGPYGLNEQQRQNTTILGVDTEYMKDARLFSEYRLHDAMNGGDAEAAVGLRNLWTLTPGLRLGTNLEHVHSLSGNKDAENTAVALAVEYVANPNWKGSTRIEVREAATQESLLHTIGVAAKINRDWTFLGRNTYSITRNKGGETDGAEHVLDRMQAGVAFRDSDTDKVNALARIEHREERDNTQMGVDLKRSTDLISIHADWKPHRPFVFTGHYAAKWTKEDSNGIATRYHAQLVSGRATWQFAPKWDFGLAASGLFGEPGNAKQYGLGVEVGYLVTTNLWLSAGYNVLGYRDDDLATGESTQKGAYVRLRYKFDEAVFGTAGEASK